MIGLFVEYSVKEWEWVDDLVVVATVLVDRVNLEENA